MKYFFHVLVTLKTLYTISIAIFLIAIQAYNATATAQITSENTSNPLGSNVTTELAKIKQEKLAIEAKSKLQEGACYKKFAVSSCFKDVKTEKLAALNDTKRRELELNNQLRSQKEKAFQEKKDSKEKSDVTNKSKESSASLKSESAENLDKQPKTAKITKEPKTRIEKMPRDEQQRLNAANKRVTEANQKLAANQKKAQLRANKQSQSSAQTASYTKKLQQAEAHKNELVQKQAAKTKPKSASLPTPSAAEIAR